MAALEIRWRWSAFWQAAPMVSWLKGGNGIPFAPHLASASRCQDMCSGSENVTWWLIPLSKWVITPVINGISRVNPLIIGLITHLLSGMSHQVGRMQRNWWFIISGFSTSMLVYRVTKQVLVDRENCQKLAFTWASNPCLKNPKLQNPVIFWYGNQHKNERWPFGSIESTPYRLLISQNMVKLAVKASPLW